MSRGLNSLIIAETTASVVRLLFFVDLGFDSGTVYVHNGIGDITFGGNTYKGVGDFGAVEPVEETTDISPVPITLILSGLDADLMDEVQNQNYYLRAVTLYVGAVDADGALVADFDVLWKGKMDTAEIELGDNNAIRLTNESDLASFDKINGRRFTDSDQQREYSGDVFFEFQDEMADQEIIWGGKRTPKNTSGAELFGRRGQFYQG